MYMRQPVVGDYEELCIDQLKTKFESCLFLILIALF